MRSVILLAALTLAGCCSGSGRDRFHDMLLNAIVYAPDRDLLIALRAYYAGAGHWPATPGDLAASGFLKSELHLDHYQNLRFEPSVDGGLAIAFDRFVSADGAMEWERNTFSIAAPSADRQPASRPASQPFAVPSDP